MTFRVPGRPGVRPRRERETAHFAERFGLFVIIALGESIVGDRRDRVGAPSSTPPGRRPRDGVRHHRGDLVALLQLRGRVGERALEDSADTISSPATATPTATSCWSPASCLRGGRRDGHRPPDGGAPRPGAGRRRRRAGHLPARAHAVPAPDGRLAQRGLRRLAGAIGLRRGSPRWGGSFLPALAIGALVLLRAGRGDRLRAPGRRAAAGARRPEPARPAQRRDRGAPPPSPRRARSGGGASARCRRGRRRTPCCRRRCPSCPRRTATPLASSSARVAWTSSQPSGIGLPCWATNGMPNFSGCQTAKQVSPAHCS